MSLFLTFFHILGVALGVGGATISDILFFKALKDKRISTDEFALLHTLGYVLWAGLTLLFLSGLGFVLSQLLTTGTSTYLVSDWFWAKMTIVFILFCNALVMHWRVFPFMTDHLNQTLNYRAVRSHVILLACTGVVSIISWYSALTLGVTRGLDFTYPLLINIYLVLLFGGILVAYTLFLVSVFPKPLPRGHTTTRTTLGSLGVWLFTVVLGSLLVAGAWYLAQYLDRSDGHPEADMSTPAASTGHEHH